MLDCSNWYFFMNLILVFRVTIAVGNPRMVWIRCGFWKTLLSTYHQSPSLCHNKNGRRSYKYLDLVMDTSCFVENHYDSYKKLSKCLNFSLTTYLFSCLIWTYFDIKCDFWFSDIVLIVAISIIHFPH